MPRELATVRDYTGLARALRDRVDELGITRLTLDALAGLAEGHSAKILAPRPIKRLGAKTLGPVLKATGLGLIVVEIETAAQLETNQWKWKTRNRPAPMLAVKIGRGKHRMVSKRFLRKIAGRGGNMRNRALSASRRHKIAAHAAAVRWADVKRAAKGKG